MSLSRLSSLSSRGSNTSGRPPSGSGDPKTVAGRFDVEIVFRLSMSGRALPVFPNLAGCINLIELDLSDNCISRIDGLDTLESLKKLNLSSNRLQRVEGLGSLRKLEVLLLQGNQIPNLEALNLGMLAGLPVLKALVLQCIDRTQQNPVCRTAGFKAAVMQHLPRLTNLDMERLPAVLNYAELAEEAERLIKHPPPPKELVLPEVAPWLEGEATELPGPCGLDPEVEAKTVALVKDLDDCQMLVHVLTDEVGKLKQALESQPRTAS